MIAAHRGLAEGRHQQLVGLEPVRLVVIRREQPVAADDPQCLDIGSDMLAEPGLVVEVGHRIGTGGDDVAGTQEPEFADRPEFGHAHRVLHRRVGLQSEHVTEQRYPSRRVGQFRILHILGM